VVGDLGALTRHLAARGLSLAWRGVDFAGSDRGFT
jgi:hypothetical protein